MKITDIDSVFSNNLNCQPYSRRAIVMSLVDDIRDAPDIDELGSTATCVESSIYFVYNHVCKLYFELLEGDEIKLLNFVFAGYDSKAD